jgi:hypothetical protein
MMSKYEAVISMSIELDAEDDGSASDIVYGEITSRLLDVASRDNKFQMWLDVIDILGVEE